MFPRLEFATRHAASLVRRSSNPLFRQEQAGRLIAKVEEIVRRVRRAGLLFVVSVAALLAYSLAVHPMGLLLWLIALPLAGFASFLSMLWPTRAARKQRSATPTTEKIAASTLARLARSRHAVPRCAREAFNLVALRVEKIEELAGGNEDMLLAGEAKRLIGQHLPGLVDSFVALPAAERTDSRAEELADGLSAIAEELSDLGRRLAASRAQQFEIQRRFIANRFRRTGLAAL